MTEYSKWISYTLGTICIHFLRHLEFEKNLAGLVTFAGLLHFEFLCYFKQSENLQYFSHCSTIWLCIMSCTRILFIRVIYSTSANKTLHNLELFVKFVNYKRILLVLNLHQPFLCPSPTPKKQQQQFNAHTTEQSSPFASLMKSLPQ